MNLNSVIDPSLHDSPDWSHILRGRPKAAGDYEGFNFLGLGVILALIFTMPVLLERWRDVIIIVRKRPIVLIALVGFTAFALSNNIGIGLWNVHLPLPKFILTTASVFQSSGRMFWPVFYTIILTITFIIIRGYGTRVACYLLACALIIQVTDTSAGWLAIRKRLMVNPAAEWATPLKNSFWNRAAARYQKLRLIMPSNKAAHWQAFASFAARHGLATDAVYLARVEQRCSSMQRQRRRSLRSQQAISSEILCTF